MLRTERTCRIATVDVDSAPHNSSLWFVWEDQSLWFNSLVKSQRWVNLQRDLRASVIVDTTRTTASLTAWRILGQVEVVGEVPRTVRPDPVLVVPSGDSVRTTSVAALLPMAGTPGRA